jgi:UDPglucose 6-dehydrogenase
MMRVSVIGAGYVGLVTGACLAEKGHRVICVDKDQQRVNKINRAICPIYEDGLEDLLKRNINKTLCATTDLHKSTCDSEIILIAVGTPFDGNQIDLTQVREVSAQVGNALKYKESYHTVIVKSTVVPGTTDEVVIPTLEEASGQKVGVEFGVGMNPEFLTEGQAVADFMRPDRIVLGANDEKSMLILHQLYDMFDGIPKLKTNCKTAEMIKYASNAMLATQISFSNEIANLCSALGGVDIVDVMKGVHLSSYLSPTAGDGSRIQAPLLSFLAAGCGFGGSCLPKDVNALIAHGEKTGSPMPLLSAVMERNRRQPGEVIRLLRKHFASLKDVRITILGLAFKPDTDDMRESPAIPIIKELLAQKALLKGYDPVAHHEARKLFSPQQLSLSESLEDAIARVDAIVLVTRWGQFKEVPELLAKVNPQAIFVDGRRMLDKHSFSNYEGIGV